MARTPFHPAAVGLQGLITLSNEIERELARALGLNLTDYRALSTLSSAGPVTVGVLAERLGASAATTTAIVNRLETGGHVERRRVEGDRRLVEVAVTAPGYRRIMELMGPLMTATNEHLWSLPPGEQRAVADFFDVAHRHLREHLATLSSQGPA